jgi:NAD+ kinase
MLVRAEPGRISEFGVRAGGTRSRFRADGIVLATPLGSHGYAHDAGGPRLAPGVGAVTVVPVAAFGLGAPTWVVDPAGGVRLSVERDEGDVSLLVDGRERHRLAGRAAVDVATDGVLTTVDLDGG